MKAFGLEPSKLKEQFADATKKLRAQAEDTLGGLIETNAVERGATGGAASSRSANARDAANDASLAIGVDWMGPSESARVSELRELLERRDEELAALKDALRRCAEPATRGDESASREASANAAADDTAIDAAAAANAANAALIASLRKELADAKDAVAWKEEEAKEFEREGDDARRERDEAKRALEDERGAKRAVELELEAALKAREHLIDSDAADASASKEGDEESTSQSAKRALEEALEKLSVETRALANMTNERDRALKQVQSMKGVNETLQKQLAEYAKRVPELEEAKKECQRETEAIAESLADARADVERVEKALKDAEARAERLNAEQQTSTRECAALQAALAELKRAEENTKQVQSDVEVAKQRMSEGALKKSLASAETKASIASDLAKTLKNQLEAKESELGTLVEARDVLREESRRLKEEVASLTGAVAERNSAMSELAELRTELADAKRALESSSFADSSLSDVEHARDKAESELLAMAQRVATLEQQVLESQRAEDDALEKIDHNIVTSSKNDREEIDRLKTRIAELEVINAEAERSMSKLNADVIAARAALHDAETSVKTYEIDKAEMKSQLESAEIRIMNANALASASKNALEEYKRHTEESSRIAQTALIAERDAAKIAADAAEKDRDAWSVKCTEARETLESWREKARKMLADKDRELDAIRGSASPIRSKRQLFSDDEDEENKGDAQHTEEGDASRARARALSSLPEGALDESLVVYLRNVVKQFLLTPYDAHDRADALVPVITTILRFALEDEFRIKAHRASQRLKSQRAWPM